MADETETDDGLITCWCGAKGTYDELFDGGLGLDDGCGGTGVLHCYCGGDQCVCHYHGETECPGCPDCDEDDQDWVLGDDDYAYDGDE